MTNHIQNRHQKQNKHHNTNHKHKICDIDNTPKHLIDNEYIKKGYRVGYSCFSSIFKSLFQWHNETINVWSHLLPALLIVFVLLFTIYEINDHKDEIMIMVNSLKSHVELGKIEERIAFLRRRLESISCSECVKSMIDMIDRISNGIINKYSEYYHINDIIERINNQRQDFIDMYNRKIYSNENILSVTKVSILSKWPIYVFFIGAIICLTFSAVYHWFFLYSQRISFVLAKFDYAGISILSSTSFFPSYYYYFYCDICK